MGEEIKFAPNLYIEIGNLKKEIDRLKFHIEMINCCIRKQNEDDKKSSLPYEKTKKDEPKTRFLRCKLTNEQLNWILVDPLKQRIDEEWKEVSISDVMKAICL